MTLARRILTEKRGLVVPLAVALIINVGIYALVVYPLGVRSTTAADRASAAASALQAAERDMAAANALVTGRARAQEELATFYDRVLPANLDAARRLTYARLPALARKANVRFDDRRSEDDPQSHKNSKFGRLHTRMVLEGDYDSIRRFLYELETTPEFVIVDDVTLAQPETNKPVTLTLEVSTYYRADSNGA